MRQEMGNDMRIRAAIAEKPIDGNRSNTVTIQELELDDNLREKEVLVRVVACAVCHADLAAWDGHLPFPLPGVLGHEGTGVVERVRAKVDRMKAGDHVIMTFPNDGTCENCLDSKPRGCKHSGELMWSGRRYDGSSTALSRNGELVSGHLFQQSAFAADVDGTECDVLCTCRFYDFLEKRSQRWAIVLRQGVYDKDRLDPGCS
jgi:aryl-alcohol dehydrogenase